MRRLRVRKCAVIAVEIVALAVCGIVGAVAGFVCTRLARERDAARAELADERDRRRDAQFSEAYEAGKHMHEREALRRRLRGVLRQARAWKAEAVARGWVRDGDRMAREWTKDNGARRWARVGKKR